MLKLVRNVVQCCVVVGGMSIQKQVRLLRRCPEIVIATPGRLWQLIQQVNKQLNFVETLHSGMHSGIYTFSDT